MSCLSPDNIIHTLKGSEPATSRKWSDHSNTLTVLTQLSNKVRRPTPRGEDTNNLHKKPLKCKALNDWSIRKTRKGISLEVGIDKSAVYRRRLDTLGIRSTFVGPQVQIQARIHYYFHCPEHLIKSPLIIAPLLITFLGNNLPQSGSNGME